MRELSAILSVILLPRLAVAQSATSDRTGGSGQKGGPSNPGSQLLTDTGNAKPRDISASSEFVRQKQQTSHASTKIRTAAFRGAAVSQLRQLTRNAPIRRPASRAIVWKRRDHDLGIYIDPVDLLAKKRLGQLKRVSPL